MLERGRGNFPENQLQLANKLSVITVKSILNMLNSAPTCQEFNASMRFVYPGAPCNTT